MVEYKDIVILKGEEDNIKDVFAVDNTENLFGFCYKNEMWDGEFEILERYNDNGKEYYILVLKYKSVEESVNEQESKIDGADIK